jgi:two-component system sensor histidine kinase YesM
VTTIENELNNIRSYVNLQLMMCDQQFTVDYHIDEHLLSAQIPNFILEPIVENAIDHGLRNSSMPQRNMTITVRAEGRDAVIAVEDNGVGMDPAAIESLFTQQSNGYGIKNVHDRLRLIYEDQCDLSIVSQPSEGTSVTLRMPVDFFSKKEGCYPG